MLAQYRHGGPALWNLRELAGRRVFAIHVGSSLMATALYGHEVVCSTGLRVTPRPRSTTKWRDSCENQDLCSVHF